jgi:hypothetical protein
VLRRLLGREWSRRRFGLATHGVILVHDEAIDACAVIVKHNWGRRRCDGEIKLKVVAITTVGTVSAVGAHLP